MEGVHGWTCGGLVWAVLRPGAGQGENSFFDTNVSLISHLCFVFGDEKLSLSLSLSLSHTHTHTSIFIVKMVSRTLLVILASPCAYKWSIYTPYTGRDAIPSKKYLAGTPSLLWFTTNATINWIIFVLEWSSLMSPTRWYIFFFIFPNCRLILHYG